MMFEQILNKIGKIFNKKIMIFDEGTIFTCILKYENQVWGITFPTMEEAEKYRAIYLDPEAPILVGCFHQTAEDTIDHVI